MNLPAVARDQTTEEFFDGTAEGVYLIRRCLPHGHASKPQATQCAVCASPDLRWDPSSGRAQLASWTVVPGRRTGSGGLDEPGVAAESGGAEPEATIVAIGELEEGPWMWARLVGADPSHLREGMALRIAFERPPGSEAIPVLTPAAP
jgi:uncharacterized OB-fold protein